MFERDSRYYHLEDRSLITEDGRQLVYKSRRLLDRHGAVTPVSEVEVGVADRPDLLATRALRNPLFYWRLCDANHVMRPNDLTATPGRRVTVPLPKIG